MTRLKSVGPRTLPCGSPIIYSVNTITRIELRQSFIYSTGICVKAVCGNFCSAFGVCKTAIILINRRNHSYFACLDQGVRSPSVDEKPLTLLVSFKTFSKLKTGIMTCPKTYILTRIKVPIKYKCKGILKLLFISLHPIISV